MATLKKDETGLWTVSSCKEWDSDKKLKTTLLFHRGVHVGIQSWWRPIKATAGMEQFTVALNDVSENDDDDQVNPQAIALTSDLNIQTQTFEHNLLSIVPQDCFLTTIPLAMSSVGDTFVTIFGDQSHFLIGITRKRKLLVTYSLARKEGVSLTGFLGRIKRTWELKCPDVSFPDKMCVLGDPQQISDSLVGQSVVYIDTIPHAKKNLIAIGSALAQEGAELPSFVKETDSAQFRTIRTWLYGVSLGLILLGVLSILGLGGINFWYSHKKNAYEAEYQKVIANNKEINKLLKRTDNLAETIMRLEETFSRQTLWGKFFLAVANERPENLYFERIGTEPIAGKDMAVRVAITGWTSQESSVTKFIGKLQEMSYVTEITLSSLERNKKKRTVFGYKILCTLLLNG